MPAGMSMGRYQVAQPGSYALVKDLSGLEPDGGLRINLKFQLYMIPCPHEQVIVSALNRVERRGIEVALDSSGQILVRVGCGDRIFDLETGLFVSIRTWYRLDVEALECTVSCALEALPHFAEARADKAEVEMKISTDFGSAQSTDLVIAARYLQQQGNDSKVEMTGHFNGRVEEVKIQSSGNNGSPIAHYDFSLEMSSNRIVDTSPRAQHGMLINAPTRAVTGHDWDGVHVDWTKATYGYGAIHFHEDDLDDALWETDFVVTVPNGARSGAYAVEVNAVDNPHITDSIVFFVRPETRSTADVLLILPTFTYLAYANERMYDTSRSSHLKVPSSGFERRVDKNFRRMESRHDLGISHYDVHSDNSGTVFSSSKRPILNVRPDYFHWAFDRPREFSADLAMIGFLEKLALSYDVCTDHDVHAQGVSLFIPYRVLITGGHPEYHTLQCYSAWIKAAQLGKSLLNFGGNGFYWIASVHGESDHRLEVRRGDQGVRTHQQPAGERYFSSNGAQGGLWRSRGLPANVLRGVGCCGEGLGPGVPYRKTKQAGSPSWSWVFAGTESQDIFGQNGFGGGASGDEIDRFDVENGSPAETIVLATSTGHPDEFGLFPEDSGFPMIDTLGTQTDKIRSDLTVYRNAGGGLVFAVGSINWYSSVAWNGYENEVAVITRNIILGCLERSKQLMF